MEKEARGFRFDLKLSGSRGMMWCVLRTGTQKRDDSDSIGLPNIRGLGMYGG